MVHFSARSWPCRLSRPCRLSPSPPLASWDSSSSTTTSSTSSTTTSSSSTKRERRHQRTGAKREAARVRTAGRRRLPSAPVPQTSLTGRWCCHALLTASLALLQRHPANLFACAPSVLPPVGACAFLASAFLDVLASTPAAACPLSHPPFPSSLPPSSLNMLITACFRPYQQARPGLGRQLEAADVTTCSHAGARGARAGLRYSFFQGLGIFPARPRCGCGQTQRQSVSLPYRVSRPACRRGRAHTLTHAGKLAPAGCLHTHFEPTHALTHARKLTHFDPTHARAPPVDTRVRALCAQHVHVQRWSRRLGCTRRPCASRWWRPTTPGTALGSSKCGGACTETSRLPCKMARARLSMPRSCFSTSLAQERTREGRGRRETGGSDSRA